MNSRVLTIALALTISALAVTISVVLKADASQAMVDATISMQIKEAKVLAKGIKHIRIKSCVRMKPSLTRIMDIIESLKPFEARARALYGNELLEVAATMKDAAEEMGRVKALNSETPVQMPAQVLIPVKQPEVVQNTPVIQPSPIQFAPNGQPVMTQPVVPQPTTITDMANKAVQAVNAIQAIKTAVEAVQAAW